MTSQFWLSVIGGILSVGSVQLIIFLLRRRTDLRAVDRTSEASLLTAATADAKELRGEIGGLKVELKQLRADSDTSRVAAAQRLETAHRENQRLTYDVASLRTDLDIATRQIQDLQAALAVKRRR